MLNSIKAIQAQQLYKVQPVSLQDGSNGRKPQNATLDDDFFMSGKYNLEYPKVEGSPTLGKSLDLRI